MSPSRSWSIGALALTVLAIAMMSNSGSPVSMAAIGGAILAFTVGLWWLWRREQSARQSPVSEYLATAYGWAFYTSLVFSWESVGERWVDWLIILPPISFIPLVARRLAPMSARRAAGSDRIAFVLHRLATAVFVAAGAFLLLTVLAAVLTPIPLIAATLHFVASRFYSGRRTG